ncbi:hypothetical protein [Anaeromicropila herbilytica]|uniref:Uncharacterized protein n=1 Tax=Anaeromicropila herbilytica TaxID=2785025 RepID=A0A7R7EP58_9FIRM|nr:hypothetical protein [Anaeromicropila herbilytica]BCN32413.1 hypothetical protein bsdtb5_37080 [Anaeromicropila herbilytica]
MENSLKGLILAAGVIITCIVVGLGFYIAREARDTASNGAGQITKLNAEFNESDKIMYDGLEVSGSEVINVVNKFKNDDIGILVKTKKSDIWYVHILGQSGTVYSLDANSKSGNSVKDAQNISSAAYINPNAQFEGEVLRDSNNTIVGIKFVQS